jgi:hypothetical protein
MLLRRRLAPIEAIEIRGGSVCSTGSFMSASNCFMISSSSNSRPSLMYNPMPLNSTLSDSSPRSAALRNKEYNSFIDSSLMGVKFIGTPSNSYITVIRIT